MLLQHQRSGRKKQGMSPRNRKSDSKSDEKRPGHWLIHWLPTSSTQMCDISAEVETARRPLVLYSMQLLQPHQIRLCFLNHQQEVRRKGSDDSLLSMSLVLRQLLQPLRESLWLHILQAVADEPAHGEDREVLHQRPKGQRLTADSQLLIRHLKVAS